ncbi:hypothetical protein TUBRATIS_26790, partial [Tubulinosema ratisbonensis]
ITENNMIRTEQTQIKNENNIAVQSEPDKMSKAFKNDLNYIEKDQLSVLPCNTKHNLTNFQAVDFSPLPCLGEVAQKFENSFKNDLNILNFKERTKNKNKDQFNELRNKFNSFSSQKLKLQKKVKVKITPSESFLKLLNFFNKKDELSPETNKKEENLSNKKSSKPKKVSFLEYPVTEVFFIETRKLTGPELAYQKLYLAKRIKKVKIEKRSRFNLVMAEENSNKISRERLLKKE